MKKRFLNTIAALGLAAAVSQAAASPITYTGALPNGTPALGSISQPNDNASNPEGAVYDSFSATAGSAVSIDGDRLSGSYDMSFWVFSGSFADTSAFGGAFDTGDTGFIAFGDDQQAPNLPGPFGDPFVAFLAPVTGLYTVAVTNFLSTGTPPYDFSLTANGVPEPGSLALLGIGLAGLAARRRKPA